MLELRFDRGTLVATSDDSLDPSTLPQLVRDPRDETYRAPAACLPALEREARARGHTARFVGARTEPLEPCAPPPLREYQEAALAAWEAAERSGVVVLPTGAGKTRLAIAAIARMGRSTLCLVPTRVLLQQWVSALHSAGYDEVGRLGDGERDIRPLTVATFESAFRSMARIGDRFELLVVDEVHHFGLGARDEVLAMCAARARLGLTATPRVQAEPGASGMPLVGPVVFEVGLSELVGTHLAPYERLVIPVALDEAEARAYESAASRFDAARRSVAGALREGTYAELVAVLRRSESGRRALLAQARARRIVESAAAKMQVLERLLARHRDDRVLVFTATADGAYEIARHFLVAPLTSEVGRSERSAMLARFEEGSVRVLVSPQVLNEGLDVPEADVAIVIASSRGVREHLQRVGRVLRARPGKRAMVYEVVCRGTHEIAQATRRGRALAA